MTFVIKTRGAGGLIVAEYRCPDHGLFEVTVQRDDSGDPPDEWPCQEPIRIDHEEATADGFYSRARTRVWRCERESPWCISAPKPKVVSVVPTAAVRGGDMKDRPPGMLDTRPLAEGMPMSEWKKVQKKHQEERRHQQLIKNGLKSKKVQVG